MRAFDRLRKGVVGGIVSWVASFLFFSLLMGVLFLDYDGDFGTFFMALLLGGFLAAVAIIALVTYSVIAFDRYGKAKDKLEAIPGSSEERFAREVERCPQLKNTLISSDAICYSMESIVHIIPIREIVWIYQEKGRYGMGLTMYTADGRRHQVPVRPRKGAPDAEASMRFIMRLTARKNRGAFIGYKEEYERLRVQNFGGLVAHMREQGFADSALLEQEYIQNDYYTKDLR
ncbi:MAG: hypothetical protein NC092_05945 [Butyrivibrio sp.]|nr:hypothetical protein [Muribaculum sp.]MCM1552218.1 hypothetical protein [Butyrivibrio sp.]